MSASEQEDEVGAGKDDNLDNTAENLSPIDKDAPTFNPADLTSVQAMLEHEQRKNKKARAEQREMLKLLKSMASKAEEAEQNRGGSGGSGGSGGTGKGPGPFKRSNTQPRSGDASQSETQFPRLIKREY